MKVDTNFWNLKERNEIGKFNPGQRADSSPQATH
jgi:hypothetical protein